MYCQTGDVDLCLVPEVAIELEGENGCLPFLKQRVAEQGHAVVVVAEGESESECAETLLPVTRLNYIELLPFLQELEKSSSDRACK